jgi:lysophospholipase L1-like esterase
VRLVAASLAAAALTMLAAAAAATAPEQPRRILDLGDSLSIGTDPYLKALLPGYRIDPLHRVGLNASEVAALAARSRSSLPAVVVVSAGTNDDPRNVSPFARAVADILALAGSKRCVVWATIARLTKLGTTSAGLNRELARAAESHRNLVLVDWAGMVRRHPSWLSRDGVHANAAGYRARAAAIVTAVTSRCA